MLQTLILKPMPFKGGKKEHMHHSTKQHTNMTSVMTGNACLGPFMFMALCLSLWTHGPVLLHAQESIDQVVIVLDASGSMKQNMPGSPGADQMDAAKEALIDVLSNIPQTTHVGLLVFSASNLQDDWAYPLGPRDDNRFACHPIDRSAGAPHWENTSRSGPIDFWKRATAFGYGTFRLLVVTDGEASDADLVDTYTPDVLARGIRVDVIGVAMDQDHTLATMVHTYRRANDAATLKQAIAGFLPKSAPRMKEPPRRMPSLYFRGFLRRQPPQPSRHCVIRQPPHRLGSKQSLSTDRQPKWVVFHASRPRLRSW